MSRHESIPLLGANKHIGDHTFRAAPDLPTEQPGFERVLRYITTGTPFLFCSLPTDFWSGSVEMLNLPASDKSACGVRSSQQCDQSSNRSDLDLSVDILEWLQTIPPEAENQIVVPIRSPFSGLDSVFAPDWAMCQTNKTLVSECVPAAYLHKISKLEVTGHEMTVAIITGQMRKLLDALRNRCVITVTKAEHAVFVDSIKCGNHTSIVVDPLASDYSPEHVKNRLQSALRSCIWTDLLPPVVLSSVDGALATWLGIQVWQSGADVQYVDLGEALYPFESTINTPHWATLFQRELNKGLTRTFGPDHPTSQALRGKTGLRKAKFIALAADHGIPLPISSDEIPAPMPVRPVPFIENKIYDQSRIDDYLSLSVKRNHHANGGPVSAVLEQMVATAADLPEHRKVVAVSNGTSALHLAAATHGSQSKPMRWVSSAFNFFSCGIGHLSNTQIIDCDSNGRFDLDALKALPQESYDGVIYTNVFAQQTDWDDVAEFCKHNGKAFVVDNATGLFDRPASSLALDAPIETISAHHTKPWGVGEGGFVICNAEQAILIRKLMNFGASLSAKVTPWATNAKLSDLAAAAILDRLERFDYWSQFYKAQEQRMRYLAQASDRDISEFDNPAPILSPRAHTPFLAPHPVDVAHPKAVGAVKFQKYYKPMRTLETPDLSTPNAEQLFARVFCLSNAPEMRTVSNDEIISQIQRLVDFC